MEPEGMGGQASRGMVRTFKGSEAERSVCTMLGEDEAKGREGGGMGDGRGQERAGQALLHS